MDYTMLSTLELVNISKPTALCWYKQIRQVCVNTFENRKPFGGEGYMVEIDESLLHGKRKANRGRYLTGDRWKTSSNKEMISKCHKINFSYN